MSAVFFLNQSKDYSMAIFITGTDCSILISNDTVKENGEEFMNSFRNKIISPLNLKQTCG